MFVPLLRFHFPEKGVEEEHNVPVMSTVNPPVRLAIDINVILTTLFRVQANFWHSVY